MRIGMVCPYSFDVPGGVQSHVLQLADVMHHRGHEVSVEAGHGVFAFGGAQLVLRDGEHYIAGSDPRKDGCAVGY